nr:hypothetical protein [Rhizobium leguminosarum]
MRRIIDLDVSVIETRHVKAFLKAQANKTDRNDARGTAQMMRVNLYIARGRCRCLNRWISSNSTATIDVPNLGYARIFLDIRNSV